MYKFCVAFLFSSIICINGKGHALSEDPPPCYEIVKVPVVPADHYEQMSASYAHMSAAYEQLASEYHNSWGTIVIGADYLLWHADNQALDYAIDGIGTATRGRAYNVDGGWENGFRAHGGYYFPCDDWFLNFSWTHFETNASETTTPTPGLTLYSTRVNPAATFLTVIRATGAWDLELNTAKADLSYLFWARRKLSIIPHLGLRWDRIKDNFDITYISTGTPLTELIEIHQSINAIGPTVGLGSEWNFFRCLSLFSDFQWAFLWSGYRVSYRSDVITAAVTADINTRDKKYIGKHSLDLLVGLKWEYHLNSRSGVIVKMGWENLLWIDYGDNFYFFNNVADGANIRASNDLIISGLTIRAEAFF